MDMVLEVRIKNVYGNELIYPVNDTAKTFAQLTGAKTLTRQTIDLVVKLGYQIKVEIPTL